MLSMADSIVQQCPAVSSLSLIIRSTCCPPSFTDYFKGARSQSTWNSWFPIAHNAFDQVFYPGCQWHLLNLNWTGLVTGQTTRTEFKKSWGKTDDGTKLGWRGPTLTTELFSLHPQYWEQPRKIATIKHFKYNNLLLVSLLDIQLRILINYQKVCSNVYAYGAGKVNPVGRDDACSAHYQH